MLKSRNCRPNQLQQQMILNQLDKNVIIQTAPNNVSATEQKNCKMRTSFFKISTGHLSSNLQTNNKHLIKPKYSLINKMQNLKYKNQNSSKKIKNFNYLLKISLKIKNTKNFKVQEYNNNSKIKKISVFTQLVCKLT